MPSPRPVRDYTLPAAPSLPLTGTAADANHLHHVLAQLGEARHALRRSADAGDLGGVLRAERRWESGAAELRRSLGLLGWGEGPSVTWLAEFRHNLDSAWHARPAAGTP
ncbi:hypothetical protein M0638_13080 [Roseomonas sp. NAR14]|uniref:Uncharacterized protein n=1 Tax=Roseomonas acroporae TaxID=2937791 RepID=A0A9X1Y7B9_9PROT|nr:hypothetical protein [Roseomonas acroporae]MCK8785319.1 hypothetical protein [Roseomonas acroporae]